VIRHTFLWLSVCGILVYSWKDWYRGLCGLILQMAVLEHPDMPKSVFGIQGLNPFNLLLFNIMLAWLSQRRREGLKWDLPRHIVVLLLLYLGVVIVSVIRMLSVDIEFLKLYYDTNTSGLVSDYLVNTIKWVIPGLLLFDGCRTEQRFRLAVCCTLGVYVLLAVQVIKWMPPQYALDPEALARRSVRVIEGGIGYSRVNLSSMLAGASWAVLAARVLVGGPARIWVLLIALSLVYAQAMTAGRAGYAAWVVVGLILSVLKWRRLLFFIPFVIALVIWLAPGVAGRMTEGFTAETRDVNRRVEEERGSPDGRIHAYTVTAGRSFIWPFVVAKIQERPWVGFGRQAMLTSGVAWDIWTEYREAFPHPHNAYLELLFDNGVIGFGLVLSFYLVVLRHSIGLFFDSRSKTFVGIGGLTTALVLALMVAASGSQSFYPVEGWMCMWCAIGLMLRVRVQRGKALISSPAPARQPRVLTPATVGVLARAPTLAQSTGPMIKPRLPATPPVPSRGALQQRTRKTPTAPRGDELLLWGTA
jgi:hypothetical protein